MYTHTKVGGFLSFVQIIGNKKNHGFYEVQPNFFIELVDANKEKLSIDKVNAMVYMPTNVKNRMLAHEFPCANNELPPWLFMQHRCEAQSIRYIFVLQKLSTGELTFPMQRRYAKKVTSLSIEDYRY
jgi:hypothetical protein